MTDNFDTVDSDTADSNVDGAVKSCPSKQKSSKKERLITAMQTARGFCVLLFLIFFGIKLVLFFAEPAIVLKAWEWIPIWPVMSYQHLIFAALCFAAYTGLLFMGGFNRPLFIAASVLIGAAQFVLPFLHIASLRVEEIVGSYTTFEMTQADSEGTIFTAELFEKGNLCFTLSGLVLSVAAVVLPIAFRKAAIKHLSFLTLKRAAVFFSIWVILGMVGVRVTSSFIGVVGEDPVIFYCSDFIWKKLGLFEIDGASVNEFPSEQIYGDKKIIPTKKHFSNLEAWRKTNKNIVLVVMESMAAAQASFMGTVKYKKEKRDTTPNLRKLRSNMLLWKNHYTVHPTSMNSLFSLNCSMYPYPVGDNITATNPRIPCESLSEVLSKAGYKAALFHSGRFSFWNKKKFFKNRGFSTLRDARNMPGKNIEKFKWGIDEIRTAEAVVDFIKKNRKHPFFVEYITVFPHVPYGYKDGPWAIYPSKKRINKYHNCLRYEDAAINLVVKGVKKLGLEDDTLFVFVSDHGEAFYEHPGNRVHSIYVYEENVHTAFAMYNPILFPKPRSTNRVTSHIDVLPTIADLLELQRGKPWQGKSLLQDAPSPLVYFLANWGTKFGGVRDGRYKAIWDRDKDKIQLFDLKKDRRERRDLAEKFSNRLLDYRSAIAKWWAYQIKLIPTFGK